LLVIIAPAEAEAPHKDKEDITLLAYDDPRAYAKLKIGIGWEQNLPVSEYKCLLQLWGKESAWNHLADNPKSTAYGIAQMLNEDSKPPKNKF
jgi:resuscitation-promoting factor RpfB